MILIDIRYIQGDILIERIPATMTVDKTELDFGIDPTLNSLSFSLVNPDYATMIWSIGGLEDWIKVDPIQGELLSGKTETVIVSINRNHDKIKPGDNTSVIVVRSTSGHGSAEVSVKVVGEAKEAPSVNIIKAADIMSQSATLHGKITNPGIPRYEERGFYYSGSSIDENNLDGNPSIFKVTCPADDNDEFSYKLTELQIDKTYFAKAFVVNRNGRILSTNEITFKPSATVPTVSISEVTDVNVEKKSVLLKGNVMFSGDPLYSEKGFVYSEESTPTIYDKKIVVEGTAAGEFSAPITSGLELGKKYYVRAYIRQLNSTFYSDETINFSLNTTQPVVSVQEASSLDIQRRSAVLNGTVVELGIPNYTEKGFVMADTASPTIYDNKIVVEGTSGGTFTVPVTNLELDKTYYVRTYIKQLGATYYSSESIQFILAITPPVCQMAEVSELSYSKCQARVSGTVSEAGLPEYSRRGFVYGFTSNPKVENAKVLYANGKGKGDFSLTISELTQDRQYFVRVFVEQEGKPIYSSNELSFTLSPVAPSLGAISVSEVENNSAKISCSIAIAGDPAYTERGIVYNTSGNPVADKSDKKVVVEGSGIGAFAGRISGLSANVTYYVKAYVKQNGLFYYSEEQSFKTGKKNPIVNTNNPTNKGYTSVTLNATVTAVGDPVYNKRGFYWGTQSSLTSANSTVIVEDANSSGDYSAQLTGLAEGQKYYYRAFVLQPGETTPTLGSVVDFTTGRKPNVTTGGFLNVTCTGSDENNLNWSATLYGGLSDSGNPAYVSFGFVYGESDLPSVSDGKSSYITTTNFDVDGSNRIYHTNASGFRTGVRYHIRAVAQTPIGYVYGDPVEFTPTVIEPTLRTYSTQCEQVNGTWAVAFVGVVGSLGQPAATGFGFVYSLSNTPKIGDEGAKAVSYTKIEKQNGNYVFGVATSDIVGGKNYYVRAYAKTPLGYTYGEVLTFKTY